MEQKKSSAISKLLEENQNPNFWRKIVDDLTGEVHELTEDQIKLIRKIQERAYIDNTIKNKYYSYELDHNPNPMNKKEDKEKPLSLTEKKMISKIVYSIKMGWMKPSEEKIKEDPFERFFSNISDAWEYLPNYQSNRLPPIEAPKMELPS